MTPSLRPSTYVSDQEYSTIRTRSSWIVGTTADLDIVGAKIDRACAWDANIRILEGLIAETDTLCYVYPSQFLAELMLSKMRKQLDTPLAKIIHYQNTKQLNLATGKAQAKPEPYIVLVRPKGLSYSGNREWVQRIYRALGGKRVVVDHCHTSLHEPEKGNYGYYRKPKGLLINKEGADMDRKELISIRRVLGVNQQQFATGLDLSISTIRDYEQGRRKIPKRTETLIRLVAKDMLADKESEE